MYSEYKTGLVSSSNQSVINDKMAENSEATDHPGVSVTEHQSEKEGCKSDGDVTLTLTRKKKVFKSSVVIIPPEDIWSQIQAIREKYDPSFKRWMPHINMLYPFFEDIDDNFADAATMLKEKLLHIKSFKIVFSKDSFGYFRHKKYCTLWLKPLAARTNCEDPIEKITEQEKQLETCVEKLETALTMADGAKASTDDTDQNVCDIIRDKDNARSASANDQNDNKFEVNIGDIGELFEDEDSSNKQQKKKKKKQSKQEKKLAAKQADAAKNKVVTSPCENHPAVVSLQSDLENIFPVCNDLSQRSEDGFYPHLSVGQFRPAEVDKFMVEFKEKWSDIEFELSELCLISREDFDDPFHVRHRIPFL